MRRKITVLVLLSAVALSVSVLTLSTSADQPLMKAARANCNQAMAFFRRATADKGGHRQNAMNMTRQAIAEINRGIEYDRRHDSTFEEDLMVPVADQPNMIAAKDQLKAARENLEKATDDKGGHRKQALKLVNDAIDETQRGIDYDRNH